MVNAVVVFLVFIVFPRIVELHNFCFQQTFDISNPLSESMIDEEFIFVVNTLVLNEEGKLHDDCRDFRIRTINGLNEVEWLDYYIENGCPKTESRIWSRVSLEPSESLLLEVLYSCEDVVEDIPVEYGIPYSYDGIEDTRFDDLLNETFFYQMFPFKVADLVNLDLYLNKYERVHPLSESPSENIFAGMLLKGNDFGQLPFSSHSGTMPFFYHDNTVNTNFVPNFSGLTNNLTGNDVWGSTRYFLSDHTHDVEIGLVDEPYVDDYSEETYELFPESIFVEFYKGRRFELFPNVLFFTNDSSAEYPNVIFVEEADQRFITSKNLYYDYDYKLVGNNTHSHSIGGVSVFPELWMDTHDLNESSSHNLYFNGVTRIKAADQYGQWFGSLMAPPEHGHSITCLLSEGSSVPSYFEMKLLQFTQSEYYRMEDDYLSDWIFLADRIPPMGFDEVKTLPDSFIRVGVENKFEVTPTSGHSHDFGDLCAVSSSLGQCIDQYGIEWARVFNPACVIEVFFGWDFSLCNHSHDFNPTAFGEFASVTPEEQDDYGRMTFKFVTRKTSRLNVTQVSEEESLGCVFPQDDDDEEEEETLPVDPVDLTGVYFGFGAGAGVVALIVGCCVLLCLFLVLVVLGFFCVFCLVLCGCFGGTSLKYFVDYSKKKKRALSEHRKNVSILEVESTKIEVEKVELKLSKEKLEKKKEWVKKLRMKKEMTEAIEKDQETIGQLASYYGWTLRYSSEDEGYDKEIVLSASKSFGSLLGYRDVLPEGEINEEIEQPFTEEEEEEEDVLGRKFLVFKAVKNYGNLDDQSGEIKLEARRKVKPRRGVEEDASLVLEFTKLGWIPTGGGILESILGKSVYAVAKDVDLLQFVQNYLEKLCERADRNLEAKCWKEFMRSILLLNQFYPKFHKELEQKVKVLLAKGLYEILERDCFLLFCRVLERIYWIDDLDDTSPLLKGEWENKKVLSKVGREVVKIVLDSGENAVLQISQEKKILSVVQRFSQELYRENNSNNKKSDLSPFGLVEEETIGRMDDDIHDHIMNFLKSEIGSIKQYLTVDYNNNKTPRRKTAKKTEEEDEGEEEDDPLLGGGKTKSYFFGFVKPYQSKDVRIGYGLEYEEFITGGVILINRKTVFRRVFYGTYSNHNNNNPALQQQKHGERCQEYNIKDGSLSFEGAFQNGVKEGRGIESVIHKGLKHNTFEGHFKNGLKHGRGEEVDLESGEVRRGTWINGVLDGKSVFEFSCPIFKYEEVRSHLSDTKIVGKGANGVIYSVKTSSLSSFLKKRVVGQKSVAIKMMKVKSDLERNMIYRMIRRGIGYCYSVKSDYILESYAIIVGIREIGYIMKECEKSIDDVILEGKKKKTHKNSMGEKIRILKETALGIQALHENFLIHRDLKWGNVLMDYDGTIKLTDFDTVKEEEFWRLRSMIQSEGVGTQGFRPPEVIIGEDFSRKSDTYAFGLMIYSLLWENLYPYNTQFQCPTCGVKMEDIVRSRTLEDHVAHCKLRPLLNPEEIRRFPSFLINLMVQCWDENPFNRPSIGDILFRFELTEKQQFSKVTLQFPSHPGVVGDQVMFLIKPFSRAKIVDWIEKKFENPEKKKKKDGKEKNDDKNEATTKVERIEHGILGTIGNDEDVKKVIQNEENPILLVTLSHVDESLVFNEGRKRRRKMIPVEEYTEKEKENEKLKKAVTFLRKELNRVKNSLKKLDEDKSKKIEDLEKLCKMLYRVQNKSSYKKDESSSEYDQEENEDEDGMFTLGRRN